MGRHVWRLVSVVIGIVMAVEGVAAQSNAPPPVDGESTAAAAWQKLWHPRFRPAPGSRTVMEGARWLGDRFAIVGGDHRGAVVWWSEDGLEWTRSRPSEAMARGAATSIAGDENGYVMIGYQFVPRERGRIWYSADGLDWREPESELIRMAETLAVTRRDDGTFVAYGAGAQGGCWIGTSTDGGASWDQRVREEWDTGAGGGCSGSVERDSQGLVARLWDGIAVSADGTGWEQVASGADIRLALAGAQDKPHRTGLVPLGDDRFLLGGYDATSLLWSRDEGLELVDGLVDWTSLKRGAAMAFGPERAIAVRPRITAPLVSPPADVYTERWERREPVCRPGKPKIRHIAAMRPVERLECFGGRDLTFRAWIPYFEYGGICQFEDPHAWMLCSEFYLATGPGLGGGYVGFGLAPGAEHVGSWGDRVRVTGHFDDPAAARCPEPGWDGRVPDGWQRRTRASFVNECRRQFVVTKMRVVEE
jgi:hypothetical protein